MGPGGERWIGSAERGLTTPAHPFSVAGVDRPHGRTSARTIVRTRYPPGVDAGDATNAVDSAWQRVLAEWDDEKAHKTFLMLCASTDRLAEAGRRYREVRERDADRAEVASAQIDRVLGLAMQSLSALKTEPRARSAKTTLLLIATGVSGAMIASALWALLRML